LHFYRVKEGFLANCSVAIADSIKDTYAFLPMMLHMLHKGEQVPELKPNFSAFEETKVKQALDC
jgi:hypothetical protein